MKGKIYYLNCPENQCVRYVGQTIQKLENRLGNHIYDAKRGKKLNKFKTHKNNWINDLIEKGLEKEITIHLIEECDLGIIDERERFWINHYKSNKLTNTSVGGIKNGMTDEIKEKISLANSGEKNGMFGRHIIPSNELKEKRRVSMINSEKFQKSRKSEEYRKKISSLQKIDDWLLLDEDFNIIKTFNSSNEVSIFLNCTKGNVKNARRDKRKLCKKYWIVYKKDYKLNE